MAGIKTREVNGIKVETYELSDSQFDSACKMIEQRASSLEDAAPFVEEWITTPELDEGYRKWLAKCVDAGASIYIYKEGWQPISEIAVFD